MNPPDRLEELLLGSLDGTLTDSEQQELARLLRESPAARQRWRSLLQVEGGLLALGRAKCLQPDTTPARPPLTEEPVVPAESHLPRPKPGHFRRPVLRTLAALAAGVLLAIGLWYWQGNRHPIATPVPTPETVSPDGRTLLTGDVKRHPLMLWDVLPLRKDREPKLPAGRQVS